ncbi:MAG: homoserine O-succinyltransferase [Ruminococcus sp.]|nr:homoserine O-succinyltransferase [Ruminococcus sp.]
MPICISPELPAYKILAKENIFVMDMNRAAHQDIRPLHVLVVNLMPKKIETECQFLRLLSNTPLQVEVEFLHVSSHICKNTSQNHLATFYRTFSEINDQYYDGCIITGAPVEHLAFEEVDYWEELCIIMEWTKSHVFSTMHICWAAFAGLYYHFHIPKFLLPKKMFGVFPQYVLEPHCQLLRGFNDIFHAPHSRHAEVHREDIEKISKLCILTESPISGVHIVANQNGRQYFITGHSEYNRFTLRDEYLRDLKKGADIQLPYQYFPNDDSSQEPHYSWGCSANLLFFNWLNYCIYQLVPYDLSLLELYNWEWEAGL